MGVGALTMRLMGRDVVKRFSGSATGSVFGEFAASAGRLQGLILGLLGVGAAVIVWFMAPDAQIRVAWLWIVSVVLLIIIWLLIDVVRRLLAKTGQTLPEVVTALSSNGLTNRPILILEESDLFGHQAIVTVYYTNDSNIELQVGSGHVSTIQTDRRIQVEVTQWVRAHEAVLNDVKRAAPDTLKRILVKPTATYDDLNTDFFAALPFQTQVEDDQGSEDGQ